MKVTVSTIGRFSMFHIARQLKKHSALKRMYTGYPFWKVEKDLRPFTKTFPWVMVPHMASYRFGFEALGHALNRPAHNTLDRWVSKQLEDCDVFVALSKSGLYSMRAAKARGIATVCHRGSSHISYQNEILAEEYSIQNLAYKPIPDWALEKELHEYAEADLITVPSTFAYQSFLDQGIPEAKLAKISYGVDLSVFHQVPKEDDVFRVLYVGTLSLQKGVPYVLAAFSSLKIPNSELVLIGALDKEIQPYLHRYNGTFCYLGFIPRTELYRYYSQASVFVTASIQEGLAGVQAQAMACGVPVIGTKNSGAEDLFVTGDAGFIVPIRDVDALREKILYLYENPDVREQMSLNALNHVQKIGGWDEFGNNLIATYDTLIKRIRN